jgi:hypothetical protein
MPTDTEIKYYTEEELGEMSFAEKQMEVRRRGFKIVHKTEAELNKILQGQTDAGGILYDRKTIYGYSDEEWEKAEAKGEYLPHNTYLPVKNYDKWMKIIAQNPEAFTDIDLSDRSAEIVHILDEERDDVRCACGARFTIPRSHKPYRTRNDSNPVSIFMCPGVRQMRRGLDGKPEEVWICLDDNGAKRKYIVHTVPE